MVSLESVINTLGGDTKLAREAIPAGAEVSSLLAHMPGMSNWCISEDILNKCIPNDRLVIGETLQFALSYRDTVCMIT